MKKIFAWIGAFALVLSTGYVVDAQDYLKKQAGFFEGAFFGKTVDGAPFKVLEASGTNLDIANNGASRWRVESDGDLVSLATNGGDINLTAAGKTVAIQEGTAASACSGTVTFNGTTAVTKSTTCAATGARIFLTPTSDPTGSTAAYCWVTNIVNGTSFDVDCDQANDGTANWIIFKEAP